MILPIFHLRRILPESWLDRLRPISRRLPRRWFYYTNDRRLWNAFLVRVHQDEALFDPSWLGAWLRQEGWPEESRWMFSIRICPTPCTTPP